MELRIRTATIADLELFWHWKNDPEALKQSFDSNPVSLENHTKWFTAKLQQDQSLFLVVENEIGEPVGHVRFETEGSTATIGITVDPAFRGMGLGAPMLKEASRYYFESFPDNEIHAYIKTDNLASYKAFVKAGFGEEQKVDVGGVASFLVKLRKVKG
ncbi:MAG: GNAT family N-acetyltransferase [Fluviicola sp.]|nr:GNAT family N-acetyltransferase [Fluviicola sp.]